MRLYHNPASSCSQKVRMALAEKGLAFDSTIIDLQQGEQFATDYLALNPNGVVPTLEDQGQALVESTLINEYLDDAYPQPALKPEDATLRHQMRAFCRKIDDALHPACSVITYAIGVRPALLSRPKEEVDALVEQIPNATRRAIRRSVVDDGVHSSFFKGAMLTHRELFDAANEILADSEWLAGPTFSLADCALLPYTLRIDHLGQSHEVTGRAHLSRWYDAIRARPSYHTAVTEWLPDALIQAFAQAGQAVHADIDAVMTA